MNEILIIIGFITALMAAVLVLFEKYMLVGFFQTITALILLGLLILSGPNVNEIEIERAYTGGFSQGIMNAIMSPRGVGFEVYMAWAEADFEEGLESWMAGFRKRKGDTDEN